jgi:26S proteasome regulatory subunit T1
MHFLKGQGAYAAKLKKTEQDIKEVQKRIDEKLGAHDPFHGVHRLTPIQA